MGIRTAATQTTGASRLSDAAVHCREWYQSFANKCGDYSPDKTKIYLPHSYTINDLFNLYEEDLKKAQIKTVSRSTFYSITNGFNHIEIAKVSVINILNQF